MRPVDVVVVARGVAVVVEEQGAERLGEAGGVLREWQRDEAPMQLHPGDPGWYRQHGAEATAAAVPTWSRDGRIVAVGLLDGPGPLRLTTAPDVRHDEELAQRLVADLADPQRGVLPSGAVSVEAPVGALVQDLLSDRGWRTDEPRTILRCDSSGPVEGSGVRIEVVGPKRAHVWAAVHRAASGSVRFTEQRWQAMAGGSPCADARCLIARDDQGEAVASVAVRSAGPGGPGVIEPMGVHGEHRGHGYGEVITPAAVAALHELGSSSAMVCAPSSDVGALATHASAGFRQLPERRDRSREARSATVDRPRRRRCSVHEQPGTEVPTADQRNRGQTGLLHEEVTAAWAGRCRVPLRPPVHSWDACGGAAGQEWDASVLSAPRTPSSARAWASLEPWGAV